MCKPTCNAVVYFDATVTPMITKHCGNELVFPWEIEQGKCGLCSRTYTYAMTYGVTVYMYKKNFGQVCKIEGCNETVNEYWGCNCGHCDIHHITPEFD